MMPQRPLRQQLSGPQSAQRAALPEQQTQGGVSAQPRACQLQGQQLSGLPLWLVRCVRPCQSGPPRQCATCRIYRAVLRLCNSSWRPKAQPRDPQSSSDCPLQLQHLMVGTALLLPLLALLQPLAAQLRLLTPLQGALTQRRHRFDTRVTLTSSALPQGRQPSR